ncbi:TRAP transporter substrate-binding protein DctP [Mesorhizobium sp. CAU 1741]|uniref:TRAP transporter substrate-binding protein DctP n=1 Tax=Mesorhizobium sp. CAU 1741 TaxID=3140366 RepID=UPI00325A6C5D
MKFGPAAVGTILSAATIALSLGANAAHAQEAVTLRFASAFSPMSANNQISVPAFIAAVEEASEGTLKIEHFPGGTIGGSPVQQLAMVEAGTADIAEVVVAYTPNRFPELGLFELPFLAESNVEAGLAAYKLYEKELVSGLDGLMLVGVIMSGPYGTSATSPLESLSDLSGLRIRAAGPIQTDIVTRLGGTPVGNVPAPGIAENISRGLLDGTLMTPGNLYNFRIADAAKHHHWELPLGSVGVIFPMRRDTFENLPPKAKEAFETYSGEWFTRVLGENLDTQQQEAEDQVRADAEHTVHSWSEEDLAEARTLLEPVKDQYDVENSDGVNVYREILAAFEDVRANQ